MLRLSNLVTAGLVSLAATLAQPVPASAYPVDCAILLCLAGGWPASAACAQARAVFIRRITPWPIEPPLQIWNCPMHVSLRKPPAVERLFDISAPSSTPMRPEFALPVEALPRLVAGQADIDISDPAFDFVRSIRVFEITYRQWRNSDGDCTSWSAVIEGGYGEQGDYRRRRSTPAAVPDASDFNPPASCGSYWHRSVFVEWRDFEGGYGFEEVHY